MQQMKTIRFENEFNEKAKETGRGIKRLVVTTPTRVRGEASGQCDAPLRPTGRKRANAAPEAATIISAKVDVGFGNTLFIRGEGEGLSWDKGQALNCTEDSIWIWSSPHARNAVTFKLLVNDQLWCRGENLQAAPGSQVEVVPAF
jgi:hypothetical protein